MLRLLQISYSRAAVPRDQMLMPILASSTSTSFLSLSSYYSSSLGYRRNFSTARSQEEIEVKYLPTMRTPWLMLRPEVEKATGDILERFYSPEENRVVKRNRSKCLPVSNSAKCISSIVGGWLGYADPCDCSVYMSNLYSNQVIQLPSLTTLPSVAEVERDPETGAVTSVHESSGDFLWSHSYIIYGNIYIRRAKEFVEDCVTNMAVNHGNVVVAVQGDPKRLVYCPVGEEGILLSNVHLSRGSGRTISDSSLKWLGLQEDYSPGFSYHQAVYSDATNLFYTIFENTGIQAYDLETNRRMRTKMLLEFPMENIKSEIKKAAEKWENPKLKALDEGSHRTHYYLVAPNNGDDDLLLLVKHYRQELSHHETLYFDIFKVDFRWQSLQRVDDLSDYGSLFVGLNQSFATHVKGLRPNCIYFTDDLYDKVPSNRRDDCGIFDTEENRIIPFDFQDEQEKVPFSENCDYTQFWVSPDYV